MPAELTDQVRKVCEEFGYIVPCRMLARMLGTHRCAAADAVRELYGPDPLAPLERQAAGHRELPAEQRAYLRDRAERAR